jgi:hypothetical protein
MSILRLRLTNYVPFNTVIFGKKVVTPVLPLGGEAKDIPSIH